MFGRINVGHPLYFLIKKYRMKKIVCLLAGVFACFQLFSQGVDFKSVSLKEALEQAKTQGKMVFVDCYTTWCGPCKYMTSNVFPQEAVGDYFNPNFVCLKIDMEKGEGPELVKRYGIRAFPTFPYSFQKSICLSGW